MFLFFVNFYPGRIKNLEDQLKESTSRVKELEVRNKKGSGVEWRGERERERERERLKAMNSGDENG